MSLFPLLTPPEGTGGTAALPLFREPAWDFGANRPIWRGGEPVYVSGASAVLVWAWNALHTEKGLYDAFTRDYGLGIRALVGQPYSETIKQSEGSRYVRECLMTNPYITAVEQVDVTFEETVLTLTVRIRTIYGEVTVDGCRIAGL